MTNQRNFADPSLLDALTEIASRASLAIIDVRKRGAEVRTKADCSPVTEADEAAEAIILDGLAQILPGIDVVSEEAATKTRTEQLSDTFILVDPLDGTREFIEDRDEFTVNIAIIANGQPVCGVVGAPALATIWRGAVGLGAERLHLPAGIAVEDATQRMQLVAHPHQGGAWRAVVSRSHLDPATEQWLQRFSQVERVDCGSSVKFCRIAEGAADVYPRLGRTSEWDIAAGHAVLTAAGGVVLTPDGGTLPYGQLARDLKVPSFVAWCSAADAKRYAAV